MARIITVTSGKGGVGKTTVAANLGVALAQRGRRVVLIDADIGLRNLDVIMGLENRVVYNILHVTRGVVPVERALIRDKHVSQLSLLAADQHAEKEDISPEEMIDVCQALEGLADWLVIDSPAGIEQGFRNALAPATEVILITTPDVAAVRDADRVIGLVEASGKPTPWLVLNRLKPDLVARGDMLATEDVVDVLRIAVLGVIPEDSGIVAASNRGEPIVLEPASRAGQALRNIAARLEGEDVPFLSFDGEARGIFDRLARLWRAAS